MMNGVVGFELAVERLEGKYKLSQNRSDSDQLHVAESLVGSEDPAAAATAH
jgi:transcriptional regulator